MNYLILSYFLFFNPASMDQKDYINITELLNVEEFEEITQFILKNGDQKTYCNRYNNNPHLEMAGFDLFLTPENTNNVSCNPEISGFNEIVIYDVGKDIQYYHILLVRNWEKGESADSEELLINNQVYLRNIYNKNQSEMQKQMIALYLPHIKQKCIK